MNALDAGIGLDPEIRAMAEETRAQGLIPIEQVTVAQARAGYNLRYRERSLPPRGNVQIDHLRIPAPHGGIDARLYRPVGLDGAAPLLVYFHGGGFVLGNADAYELQSMRLAELARCAVLFAEYRLAPEYPFPAAVEDAYTVVHWAAHHAAALNLDSARLAVAGDSAGGNLCINACMEARDRAGPPIALQCLLYPLTDFRPYCGGAASYHSIDAYSEGYLLDRAVMEWFARSYLPDPAAASDPKASPLLAADFTRLPQTLLVTAQFDPLRDMGAAIGSALLAAGGKVEQRCMAGLAHNFMGHAAKSTAARRAFEDVAQWLREHLARASDSSSRKASVE